MDKASIKRIAWTDVSKRIHEVNPNLAKTIDELDPPQDYALYKVSYPYGSSIVENGVFNVPLPNGDLVPLNDPNLDKNLSEDFAYANGGLPAGIVTDNSYELFINTKNCILPILVTKPGSVVSLWKEFENTSHFHPTKIFSINAGARCIFMLPNVSDLALHKNLKRDFNVRQRTPSNLLDQWEIFKTIAHHPEANCNWATEIVFFSGKWFNKIKKDKAWQSLYLLLLQDTWNSSAYERNRMFYDFVVSCAQANRNLKPNPYLTDTLKHLIMIGLGTGVGFSASFDESLAPIKLLQKVYLESYGLRKYAPTLMHPIHFSQETSNPVYYSLLLPTTLSFSPKSRKISSTLHDLSELKHILRVFLEEVSGNRLYLENTVIDKLAAQLNFDFFHSKHDMHGEIKHSREIVTGDKIFMNNIQEYSGREFAESGAFVRGCVRISQKDYLV